MCAVRSGDFASSRVLTVKEKTDHLADVLSHLLHLCCCGRIILHILAVHNFSVKVLIFLLKLGNSVLGSLLALFSLLLLLKGDKLHFLHLSL